MYTTIEAELKDGRIIPLEPEKVPMNGKVLVTVIQQGKKDDKMSPDEWMKRWDELTATINASWKSDKSAVEILSGMRR